MSGEWLNKDTGVKNAHLRGIHLRLPVGFGEQGPTLEIFEYSRMEENLPPTANRKGFGHIAFHVDDLHEINQKVISNGGKALGDIAVKEIKGVGILTFVYMTDPEGNIIEIQNWS